MRRLHRRLGGRLVGALLASLIAAQAGGASFAALRFGMAPCCCHHEGGGERKCHCPVCTHQRTLAEGKMQLRTCGGGDAVLIAGDSRPALPPQARAEAPAPERALPESGPSRLHQPPVIDVPTPPPLA